MDDRTGSGFRLSREKAGADQQGRILFTGKFLAVASRAAFAAGGAATIGLSGSEGAVPRPADPMYSHCCPKQAEI
jgi:hypothetical protein